jgi:hypothetical protein
MWKIVVSLAPLIAAETYNWPSTGAKYDGDMSDVRQSNGKMKKMRNG